LHLTIFQLSKNTTFPLLKGVDECVHSKPFLERDNNALLIVYLMRLSFQQMTLLSKGENSYNTYSRSDKGAITY